MSGEGIAHHERQPSMPAAALRHYWHPVLRSDEVTDKPASAKLLDTRLVIWRSNGQVFAFHDLCIHRGTPLSLGWIDDGQLVCAYHGWYYGTDGLCTRIPSLPADRPIPNKARAKSYHAQERYGLIWICLDEPRTEVPQFPPEFDDPTFQWDILLEGRWQANAARMIENLADYSHFAWVHPGILGDRNKPECPEPTIEPSEGGFQYDIETPVNRFTPGDASMQRYQVILPFSLILQIWQPGGHEKRTNIFICSPVSINETKYFRFSGRNSSDPISTEAFIRRHYLIWGQDQTIVEAQRPEEVPLDLSDELHLRGADIIAVEYRKRLGKLAVE